jgi:hypothetical protein
MGLARGESGYRCAQLGRIRIFGSNRLRSGPERCDDVRPAEGPYNRFPEFAADLVRRRVSVIVAPSTTPAALAAKTATMTILIVFGVADEPVKLGPVANFARPGGNATGTNFFIAELAAKRLGLLREFVTRRHACSRTRQSAAGAIGRKSRLSMPAPAASMPRCTENQILQGAPHRPRTA